MFRVWKLIKQRKTLYAVGIKDLQQVGVQRLGVARDVYNVVKVLKQLHSLVIQTCSWWVYLHLSLDLRATAQF